MGKIPGALAVASGPLNKRTKEKGPQKGIMAEVRWQNTVR